MINYSISLRANPSDQDAPKKAYANAQYSEIMTLDKFAEHISTHGSKYNRADIQAVLIQAVDCMKDSVFNLVPTRKAAKLVVKALKAGKNTVDLTGEASGPDDKTEENA